MKDDILVKFKGKKHSGKVNAGLVIRRFCADCAGTALDATLCTILDCKLWPLRIGRLGTKGYKTRMVGAFSGKTLALKETLALGLTLDDFLHPTADAISKTGPLEDSSEEP
jgi:hypothetical protein